MVDLDLPENSNIIRISKASEKAGFLDSPQQTIKSKNKRLLYLLQTEKFIILPIAYAIQRLQLSSLYTPRQVLDLLCFCHTVLSQQHDFLELSQSRYVVMFALPVLN